MSRLWSWGELRRLRQMAPIAPARVIAQELGRSIPAVRLKAQFHEIPLQKRDAMHHRSGYPQELRDAVRSRYDAGGTSTNKLAAEFGIPKSTVIRWVNT